MKTIILTLLLAIIPFAKSFSQNCTTLNLQLQVDIASTCQYMTMTMIHDSNNLPYLYVANKEDGLKVYNITTLTSPVLVATVPTTLFDTLDVMNVSQNGNYLYLALGNSFTNSTKGGMAIIDVTNPTTPTPTDYYVVPNSNSGGGIVKVEGNFAYLGAMQSGLVILDVTDKSDIQYVSQFIPDINYPPIANPNPQYYNARGMEVKNSIVYLCYDGGGIRIINCVDKYSPLETGRWCNPVMYTPLDHPKAYNNCILNDTLLYVAVDYAGLEVLDISDTGNIAMLGWWNPNNAPSANWFNCRIHANEIQFDPDCKLIFLADGKSDMHTLDVSNPALPDSCNIYGGISNSIGTWGIGRWQNEIYLSYICALVPFTSNWTGVKILSYNSCTTGIEEPNTTKTYTAFPNPFSAQTILKTDAPLINATLLIENTFGSVVVQINNIFGQTIIINRDNLSSGLYFARLIEGKKNVVTKLLLITD